MPCGLAHTGVAAIAPGPDTTAESLLLCHRALATALAHTLSFEATQNVKDQHRLPLFGPVRKGGQTYRAAVVLQELVRQFFMRAEEAVKYGFTEALPPAGGASGISRERRFVPRAPG